MARTISALRAVLAGADQEPGAECAAADDEGLVRVVWGSSVLVMRASVQAVGRSGGQAVRRET